MKCMSVRTAHFCGCCHPKCCAPHQFCASQSELMPDRLFFQQEDGSVAKIRKPRTHVKQTCVWKKPVCPTLCSSVRLQVLEDWEALEKGNPAHRMYSSSMAGNKVSILAGDFLLARASVLLASLRNTRVSNYATIVTSDSFVRALSRLASFCSTQVDKQHTG